MDEVREYHHDHGTGSGLATILISIVVLLVLGFLLWNFLPVRNDSTDLNVNVTPPIGGENQTQ